MSSTIARFTRIALAPTTWFCISFTTSILAVSKAVTRWK